MHRIWCFVLAGTSLVASRRIVTGKNDFDTVGETEVERTTAESCRRRRCADAAPPPAPPAGAESASPSYCRRRRCDQGPPTTPPPAGPMYKCETTPTWDLSAQMCCRWNPAKAACFSLNPRVRWRCSSLRQGPTWMTDSVEVCGRKDETGNWFDGRCIVEGHQDYDSAIEYDGPGMDMTRTPAPNRFQVRHRPYSTPPPEAVSSDAIGWNPTDERVGKGYWCEVGVPPADMRLGSCSGPEVEAKVLSYNLFWWRLFGEWGGAGGSAGKLIAQNEPFDFMGFQECADVNRVLNDGGLLNKYTTFAGRNAVAIAWKTSDWVNISSGAKDVAEDGRHQYYGYREVVWSRLQHRENGKTVFFINHHGPTPVQHSGGLCGPEATAYQILKVIAERAHVGDTVVLVGDFNARAPDPAFDTVANTSTVSLIEPHMNLLYRGWSFGGIDNFYTNCATVVATEDLGAGDPDTVVWQGGRCVYGGSDHEALSVTMKL